MRKLLTILFVFISLASIGQDRCCKYVTRLLLANVNIVGDGNSYMQGNGHTPALTYLSTYTPYSTNGATIYNFGVGSETTVGMLTDQYSQILPNFKHGVINFLIIEEGGNDIGVYGMVDSAMARMRRYCFNAQSYAASHGIYLRIIVSTKIPRDQASLVDNAATFNLKLIQFNDSTLADNSGAWNFVVRPDTASIFATYGSTGYDPDRVHPSDIGQAKYADLYDHAIMYLSGWTSMRKRIFKEYKQTA